MTDKIFEIVKDQPFPGTQKWPADHPIWDCNIAGHISPKAAWQNADMLKKAAAVLAKIYTTSKANGKYPEFAENIEDALAQPAKLAELVLSRFTVAKLAPKVTALMPSTLARIIQEAGVDLSSGVYCPMAGFGGIVEGCKRLGVKDIEAYDINEDFCKWYGWTKRDALAQTIITDKVVVACPPFGTKTERWPGTPDCMYYDFEEWCELLQKHIIAPNYVFIGPELENTTPLHNSTGVKRHALFRKKIGVAWWPQYTYERPNAHYIRKYFKLVKYAKSQDRNEVCGVEQHHIVPKSFYNNEVDNSENNLVKFTVREHIQAHILLNCICTKHPHVAYKMAAAVHMMLYSRQQNAYMTTKQAAKAKNIANILRAKRMREIWADPESEWRTNMLNGMQSDESREKLRQYSLGKTPWIKGKHLTDEAKEKIRQANLGEKNPNFGKHRSAETIQKMREAHLGKKHSDEAKEKISERVKAAMQRPEVQEKLRESHLGQIPWNKGKTDVYSDETIEKISKSLSGENHPNFGKHLSDKTKEAISKANKGRKRTDEQKAHMSAAQQGHKAWNKGATLSDAHRQAVSDGTKAAMQRPEVQEKMSAGMKARWQDPAFREKLTQIRRNRAPASEATREKMSKSLRGKKRSEEQKARYQLARQKRELLKELAKLLVLMYA